ncbi:glycoside hydrolase family 3 N-terminal domain-containing protein [Aliiglaciecola sp. 3_MG-2023]|uniref:glycoside hydrolase family 3 N-terminal domain-containing protein n=1 Tax=Aliiglaciecola sp. 3_MG-2023 TaxID=3062644 RepID=UPI0026E3E1FB|nr:glycoside hydrolase family 3 N-terminal domain-containing protein [Aliiglaciecola sp. 3_MG-2023]MDO6694144.1 glycoside hydrolase family 3 N-terminal domain-containing protein [Aliiglaciecola sp. 3_MG-2023]
MFTSEHAHSLNSVPPRYSDRINHLLSKMHLVEKVGQLSQVMGNNSEELEQDVRQGLVGSVINEVDVNTLAKLQHIATHQSRLGIPLLVGRDVIHGFKTIFPIPLGQAASWDPELVKKAAKIAGKEASFVGINWTFAPMIDISRDPRWGRIAESFGEDPVLSSIMGVAMVEGFQGDNFQNPSGIAACAKHFVGYGASESGRDYCTTNIPENELRNIYFPPFKAAADAGVATFMSSFSDLDGLPASGNKWLMDSILRKEWNYQGFVVSDWESIAQLQIHGLTESPEHSALTAFDAGIDMEMVSTTYRQNLATLLENKQLSEHEIDQSVLRILHLKEKLGLFDIDYPIEDGQSSDARKQAFYANEDLDVAKQLALKSCVLLQNKNRTLPLNSEALNAIGLIGPLADDGYEQLGTWIFDGEEEASIPLKQALENELSRSVTLNYAKGLQNTRTDNIDLVDDAIKVAQSSDVVILCLGEESFLSGEAHCRAELDLPGKQHWLIEQIAATGKPIVLVIMAGRPLTLEPILNMVDSVLYAWHPGTMGGPAIADLILGESSPSGKLPVTFPRKVGQIPIYYNQKHTGKPATEEQCIHMDDVPERSPQTSLGMAATHLDTHFSPLYEFGFGLSYGEFEYTHLVLDKHSYAPGESINVKVTIKNVGRYDAEEVIQLYIRDLVGSVTRPVKELKQFKRVLICAGKEAVIYFKLEQSELAFYNRNMQLEVEAGTFHVWVSGSSKSNLTTEFIVTKP